MAFTPRLGSLLFLCVLWPIIISSVSCTQACSYDDAVARETGRNCTNKLCSVEIACNRNRECLCDGACGYRCISTRRTPYCNELPSPLNGSVEYSTENQAFGSRATYDCDPGYLLSSEGIERMCLGDGEWSIGETPQCLPQEEICPRLESVNRTCFQHCTLRSDCPKKKQESCLCDGDCGMSCLPVYVPGYCPEVELSANAVVVSMTTKKIVFSSVVTLGCEDPFKIQEGSVEITCLINRTWSGQPLHCRRKVACNSPPEIEGVRHDSWEANFYPGDELLYTCRPGYHGYGVGQRSSCREDLQWTSVSLDCYPISCGDPGYLRNGWREGNLFTFRSRVTFHCNAGYEMQGYPYRTCMSNQRWTSFLPSCVAIECAELYAPEHGSMQGKRFTYDSEVYLECENGYKLIGSERRRCQSNKTWSGEETTCRVITCLEPEAPLHGSKISPRYGLDAIARFSCNQGYTLIGSRTARCTEDETWSQPTPECQAYCTVLSPPAKGYYASSRFSRYTAGDVVEHGTVIEIVCNSRWYSLNSEEEYTCYNGEWSFDAQCVATPCSKLPELLNGLIRYQNNQELVNQSLPTVPHDTRATYSCRYGFELQGEHSTPECYYGVWWYTSNQVCSPKLCSQEGLQHGSVHYTKNSEELKNQAPYHGVSRTFECSSGYNRVPARTGESVCANGIWSASLPACEPDACSTPTVFDGYVRVESMRHDGTAQVECYQGWIPSVGDGSLRCHAGHWVPDGFMCIGGDEPFNVAYRRPASQSLTSDESSSRQASLAVDGDRTIEKEHGSCTFARKSGGQLFWEVNLEATYRIEYIVIYTTHNSKLIGATVQVGFPDARRETYSQCGLTVSAGMAEGGQPSVRMDCNPDLTAGQIVRIESQIPDKLSLCEVEVFATGPIRTCRIHHIDGLIQRLKDNDEVLLINAQVSPGTRIAYSCGGANYQRNGAVKNQCKWDGTWANANPSCDAADCEVRSPINGKLTQQISRIQHNSELQYSCYDAFEKQHMVTRCEFGVLTPVSPPKCVHKRCFFRMSDLGNNIHVRINNQQLDPDTEGNVYIPHNTYVSFGCERGYELTNGNTNTLCWMGRLLYYTRVPSCSAVPCDNPPRLWDGSYHFVRGNRYEHGDKIRYKCNPGKTLQDPAAEYSDCDNGGWRREMAPVCQPDEVTFPVTEPPVADATCSTPSVHNALIYLHHQNIALSSSDITFGTDDTIDIRCNRDFTVRGQAVVTATCRNGAWTPALPRCEVSYKQSCSRPDPILNVRQYVDESVKLSDSQRTLFYDESIIVSRCQDPLTMTLATDPIRRCNDGWWTGPFPVCVPSSTSFSLPALNTTLHQFMANGTLLIHPGVGELNVNCIVNGGYPDLTHSHSQHWIPGDDQGQKKYGSPEEGDSGTYICKKYSQRHVFHVLQIQVRAVSCLEPRPPLNGRRIGDDFRLTKSVSFECNEGYDLIGDRKIKCNLGQWLGETPRCRARDCPVINMGDLDPNLRLLFNDGNSTGSAVIFTCQSGFHQLGETQLTCQGGRWSPLFPTCEADAAGPLLRPVDCNCEVWERCVANPDGPSTCHCIHPQHCDDVVGQEPYCGNDGRTYANICKMKAAGCLLDLDIREVSRGSCPEFSEDCNCEVWERCVANSNGPSTCHCIHPKQCVDVVGQEPYCGNDNQTYASICRMKAAGCLLDLDIQEVSRGPCPEDPDEATPYHDYSSESSESSIDSIASPILTDGEDMPTAADRSVESTTPGSNSSIQYCETCIAQDLETACQNSTHVFVGIPQKVERAQPDSLSYSVEVITPIKGFNRTGNVNFLMQETFDETNQCYCPSVTDNDDYLFVLREDNSPASFQFRNGFVGLWADHLSYHDKCS